MVLKCSRVVQKVAEKGLKESLCGPMQTSQKVSFWFFGVMVLYTVVHKFLAVLAVSYFLCN